jgi:hypothetical protein
MAFPHASFETYTALRDKDISDPLLGSWRLGQMASWSRWGAISGDLAPITAHSQEEFDQIEPLTTRVILFAINLGGTAIKPNLEDWRNFHTKGHSGDGTLKNSIAMATDFPGGDKIPALYMTDVFKLVPTKTAKNLDRKVELDLAQGIDHVERCAAILRDELRICMDGAGGQPPTLVAMGAEAFKWLTATEKDERIARVVDEVLGDGASRRVREMDHYTFGAGTHKSRVAALRPVLKEILLEQQGVPAAS